MLKKEIKKRIELKDLDNYKENRKRVFELSYVLRGDVIRLYKKFMTKRYLKEYLKNPDVTKIKIYVCDVVTNEPAGNG